MTHETVSEPSIQQGKEYDPWRLSVIRPLLYEIHQQSETDPDGLAWRMFSGLRQRLDALLNTSPDA